MTEQISYLELSERQTKEMHAFPFFYAIGKKQLQEKLDELGLTEDDIYTFAGAGDFYRRTDDGRLREMLARFGAERKAAIAADKRGYGFIYQMFRCELENAEFTFTQDVDETLDRLGLTHADIKADKRFARGLKKAIKSIIPTSQLCLYMPDYLNEEI